MHDCRMERTWRTGKEAARAKDGMDSGLNGCLCWITGREKKGGNRCDDRSADSIASSSKVSSARFEFAGCIEGERKVKGRREGEKKGKVN